MRIVLQRVSRAAVRVGGDEVARIDLGLVGLVAIEQGDTESTALRAALKLAELRVFADDQDRMNLDAATCGAAFLIVSQFTLAADLSRGRRPSFGRAAPPGVARSLLEVMVDTLRETGLTVETGVFGAHMELELVNDGPVTFVLDVG
jgi:D-tyrosyl-tRNA(Tyr) deacylase